MAIAELREQTGPDVLEVVDPRTGAVMERYPEASPADVQEAVHRARSAQETWSALAPKERARLMEAFAVAINRRSDELCDSIVHETGKPRTEALAEIVVSVDLIRYYGTVAPRHLRPRRRSPGWMLWKEARVEREPLGVIGAITPWNYPLILTLDAIIGALFAGNAVVVKPSEFTPMTARLLPELAGDAGLPEGLVQVVVGGASTGRALVRSGVDKISFTGSSAVGREVMAAAAESLTPVTLELGGKDPAIVLDDADLERAARGIVFGAFFNGGQTCISIERVFVVSSVADALTRRIADEVGKLRWGPDGGDVGPMITGPQRDVVARHVDDALAQGARALVGGRPDPGGRHVPPTVLVDVDDSMAICAEETFGPVLPIVPVADEEEAVARANATGYGLFGSVWTGDRRRGLRLARRLQVGGVSVNDSLSHYGIASLPMGGVGASGFGRRRGVEGLDEMTRTRTILVDRLGLPREPWWFPYDAGSERLNRAILEWRAVGGMKGLVRAWRSFVGR